MNLRTNVRKKFHPSSPIAFIHSIVHLLCPKIYPENFLSGFHHQSSIARQGILQRKASQEIGSFAVAHRRAMEKASRNLKEIRCRAVTRPRPNIADERLRKEGRNKKTDRKGHVKTYKKFDCTCKFDGT